ncbi:MAG: FMN-binding protein [Candidatus Omnitrophica bacterium]|nr:FMN-binding protein [Candidatus Omnitrophota bacterium]MDD5770750.1 FMN-binding protein [Candidatus Omnitrophota bacterium]
MRETLRYGLILAFICTIAGGLLAGVNTLTHPRIVAQALAEEQNALKEVMPQAAEFSEVREGENLLYYKALDSQGKVIGFVFKASAKGYSSVIETLAGIFPDEKISAIKVISLNETPGLGMRVAESSFTDQFRGRDALSLSGVQAISGATISSRAVMDSVIKKARQLKDLMNNEK